MEGASKPSGAARGGLVDCHCHLYDERLDGDAAVERAAAAGVARMVVVTEGWGDVAEALALQERHGAERIAVCVGMHPVQRGRCVTVGEYEVFEHAVETQLERDAVVGIGECGLDYSPWIVKAEEDKEAQREVLRRQVALAKRWRLPVNVHSRFAAAETIELLKEEGCERALLHGFDGKASLAVDAAAAGYHLSMPCTILRSKQKRNLLRFIPLDRLCLESDSPCMAAVQNTINEPKNIVQSCDEIARLLKKDPDEIARVTSANARDLFG